MNFDFEKPTLTDPFIEDGEHTWCRSLEKNVYYVWTQPVVTEVQLHPNLDPCVVDLRNGVTLTIYKGLSRQEILYRIKFDSKPNRFMIRPNPHTMFWSFGTGGGPSRSIKYLYKDKNISVHCWTDKNSFLADLRYVHYNTSDYSFWSR